MELFAMILMNASIISIFAIQIQRASICLEAIAALAWMVSLVMGSCVKILMSASIE